MRRVVLVVVAALSLGACAYSRPVAVLTSNGTTLHGVVSRSGVQMAIEISGGRLTCSGIYPPAEDKVVTVTMRCSDGRSAIAIVTHPYGLNGGGTVRFSDGTEGTFVVGDGAAGI